MAKWLCGTIDRHRTARVPGPHTNLWRVAPAASAFFLCGVLQSDAHSLGITERCALASSSPTVWCHCRYSDLGRAASPIRPDMIFGKDRCLVLSENVSLTNPDSLVTKAEARIGRPLTPMSYAGRSAPNHAPSRCGRGGGRCGSCRRILRERLRPSGERVRSSRHPMPVV